MPVRRDRDDIVGNLITGTELHYQLSDKATVFLMRLVTDG